MTVSAATRRADAVRIAETTAAHVRQRFRESYTVEAKGDQSRYYDLLTDVDLSAEHMVLEAVHELSPNALVLGEEGGMMAGDGTRVQGDPAQADELWIVDPIDGTINFAHGIPHFAVSVACWQRGEPVAGALVDPMLGETFAFERDAGSRGRGFLGDVPLADLAEDRCAANTIVFVGNSAARRPEIVGLFPGIRQMASAALALAWVAAGRAGAYVQLGALSAWDWGVGVPLVQAVGGIVSDETGTGWNAPLDHPIGVIAAAPGVHRDIARVIAR